ncbi:MAG: helix-turn-helix transcriptional regulator [Acidimicrobiales bacterium]
MTPNADGRQRSEWLSPVEVSGEIQIPVRTLYAWRHRGIGPEAVRLGRHLRYRREAVDSWLASCASHHRQG